jgi:hypothetical protein
VSSLPAISAVFRPFSAFSRAINGREIQPTSSELLLEGIGSYFICMNETTIVSVRTPGLPVGHFHPFRDRN